MEKGEVVREVTISLDEYKDLLEYQVWKDENERAITKVYNLVEDYAVEDGNLVKFKGIAINSTYDFVNELLQLLYYLDGQAYENIVRNIKGK